MNDITVSAALIGIFSCHLAALAMGYKMQNTALLVSYANAVMAIGVCIFWAITSLPIKEQNPEFRELVVLFFEACILIVALYTIMGSPHKTYVNVINYIGFGFHILVTIGMLCYLLMFKFNSLF